MRNYKKMGLLSVISCFAVGVIIAVAADSNSLIFNETHAGTNDYTLVLSCDNGQLTGNYPASETSNTEATTHDGNKIEIMYNNCGYYASTKADIYAQMKKNSGYFYNNNSTNASSKIYPLTNITSITAVFSGAAPTLYLGNSKNPSTNSQSMSNGTKINVSGYNFFKVNAGTSATFIDTLTITYTCGTGPTAPVESVLESISISDSVDSYSLGETYNSAHGLVVTGIYNTGNKPISSGYTINCSGFNSNSPFTTAGNYTVSVTYDSVTSNTIQITVKAQSSTINPTIIALNKTTLSLNVGASETLTYNLTPSDAVSTITWESSSPSVASVSDGLVTASAVGTSNITATTHNGLKATCVLTVTSSSSSSSYRIQFKTSGTADSGANLTSETMLAQVTSGSQYVSSFDSVLKAYEGNGGVKLGSGSGTGAFTINLSSNGKVKAKEVVVGTKKYGSDSTSMSINSLASQNISSSDYIELKYTLADSTKTLETIELTTTGKRCYVSYIDVNYGEPEPVTMTNFTLNTNSLLVALGGSGSLIANVSPSDVYPVPSITWSSNNTNVATVSNGSINGIGVGTATITAKAKQGSLELTSTCTVTVSTIAVTGVTLNSTSGSVYIGKTMNLQANVLPSNASNKVVSWSSNATNIATVNNGIVTGLALGTAKINVTTSDGGYVATCNVTVEDTPKSAWTIMIYMCGADLESDSSARLATSDLNEIDNVTGQPDNVNVIVQAGGAKSWASNYSSVINKDKLNRFHIKNGTYIKDEQLPKANMGLASTFQNFIEWGLEEYPAERTMVVFWNHGGAMRGNCYDEQYSDDNLLNSEVNTALNAAFASTGRSQKLEIVGYDVCLAQVQDIAEFNSNYFNYMIASQESEAGYGWDYDGGWLKLIYNNPTTVQTSAVLTSIVNTFITDNGGVNSSSNDQTLSWLDLSKMAAYKTAWESMASYLNSNILTSSNKSAFQSLIKTVKHYADNDYDYFGTFDAKDFLTKLAASSTFNKLSLSTYISTTQSAFTNLIGYSSCGKAAGNSYGLCMFFAIASDCAKGTYYTSAQTNFTNWRQTNNSYGA